MKCSLLVLSSYLDGELETRRQGELEAHLVGCQRCRAGLGYLREEVERVAGLGRVRVADHSVHALLTTLGLMDEDEPLPERSGAVALAELPRFQEHSPWAEADEPGMEPLRWAPTPMPTTPTSPAAALPPAPPEQLDVDMTGSPERPPFRWVAERAAAEEPAASLEPDAPEPTTFEPPSPQSQPTPEEGVPSVPFGLSLQAPLPTPPTAAPPGPQWPPPAFPAAADTAPSAPPSGGAFPPGGPEPSDLPTHVTDPGGEPEMTASPPWAPHEAPPGPVYPLTDEDVLDEPIPVERFAPPQQADRPSLFERLRDRLNTRRALARSSAAYDDSVQIVSGSGASLRPGRARLEVERRRQEALRMDPGAVPEGSAMVGEDMADIALDDADLGPLPPPLPPLGTPMPRPPQAPMRPSLPGQMALPGTEVDPLRRAAADDPRAPVHRVPMPPPRHTLGSALGEVPPPYIPGTPPPLPPRPPAAPVPDPLGEALAGLDRDPGATLPASRPWRPREIPEDLAPAAAPPSRLGDAAPPPAEDRRRQSPRELRDGRRLLALFGAATLLMLVVGIVSGKTTSPLPTGNTAQSQAPAQHSAAPAPTAKASAPSKVTLGPSATTPSQAPAASTPQLTGMKVLGDGGTGYQVRDFRYGIHPNDFRIVLDMDASGSASGTPKATIGFQDPTTLLLVLDGVVPAGSTGQLPSSNPVVSVTQLSPSPFPGATVYQVKLAHAVTFSAGYASGPLRLVLDIAG